VARGLRLTLFCGLGSGGVANVNGAGHDAPGAPAAPWFSVPPRDSFACPQRSLGKPQWAVACPSEDWNILNQFRLAVTVGM
jgi:hypothetical protein